MKIQIPMVVALCAVLALAARYGTQMEQEDVVQGAKSVASRPSAPATAASRVSRNQGLARKTVAALADSAAA